MGRELEYKFAATPEILRRISGDFEGFTAIAMETAYYDTPDRSLSRRNCTLRLRQENDRRVFTLKTPLPDGSRGEWECQADSLEEGLAKLPQASALVQGPLQQLCGARFTRLAATVDTGAGTAELALDAGVLLGGGLEMPLCEVEVEYKSGSEAACAAFAAVLARRYGLIPESRSKFARAMELAKI